MTHRQHDPLSATVQVLYSPELLGMIFLHLQDHTSLTDASLVCKHWHAQALPQQWVICRSLRILERGVSRKRHDSIAALIHHVDLKTMDRIWEGAATTMPVLPLVKTVAINAQAIGCANGIQCLSKLLGASLRDLQIESSAQAHYHPPGSGIPGIWLRPLHRICTNLTTLSLDVSLPATAANELEMVLLGTNPKHVSLGPLLYHALSDWAVACVLAQRSLVTLELFRPIPKTALDILLQQCNSLPVLDKLQTLRVDIHESHEEVTVSLLSMTPNLTVLNIAFNHFTTDGPWYLGQNIFESMGCLKHLRHLDIIFGATLPDGGQAYAIITAGNLLALNDLPLKTLSITSRTLEFNYLLRLPQVTGSELLQLLPKWKSLDFVEVDMVCENVSCNATEREPISRLLRAINFLHFYTRPDTSVQRIVLAWDVWLGSNQSFHPDPLQWIPRQLHHGEHTMGAVRQNDRQEESDELVVWGDDVELDQEID